MTITKALPIKLSFRQETLLQHIVRVTTNSYRLVRRAQLILAAASGESNSSISRKLELDKLASPFVARAMERRERETRSSRRATSNGQKVNGLDRGNFRRSPTTRDNKVLYCRTSGITTDLGVKGKEGILQSMESREAFLSDEFHRIRFVYVPKHTSWLNQIECWFSILVRRLLKRVRLFWSKEIKRLTIFLGLETYGHDCA